MKNTDWLKSLIIGGIFLSLITPFISFSGLYFPFITSKAYFFRVLIEVVFGLWVILALIDKDYRPKKSVVLWSIVAFLGLTLASNIQGLNPRYSFWSNFERMEGFITLLHVSGYFLVISSVFKTKKIWDVFFHSIVVVSLVQVMYAIFQAGGLTRSAMTSGRSDGTFGNAIYLAAFMLMSLFITLYLWMKRERIGGIKYFYAVTILLQIITIFLTATRGTILALIGGMFVALTAYVILEPSKKVLRYGLATFIGAVVLFATLVLGFKDSAIVQNVESLKRMSDVSISGGTVGARILNWGIAWSAVKEKPVLGYGQGNYSLIFDEKYDPKLWSQENWFDRSHSLVFDLLIAGGFVALILYLSILLSAVYSLWKPANDFSNAEKSIFTAFFVGYLIHTLVVFDSLTSYMLLFIVLAFIHYRSGIEFKIFEKTKFSENSLLALTTIVVLLIPYSVWAVNADSYFQNRELIQALQLRNVSGVEMSYEKFKSALSRDSFGNQEILLQLMVFSVSVINQESIPEETKNKFNDLVYSEFNKYIQKNPKEARVFLSAGQYFLQAGNYELAGQLLDEAILLAPKKQFVYKPKIELMLFNKQKEEALDLLQSVYEINKDNDDFAIYYIRSVARIDEKEIYNKLIEEYFSQGKGYRVIKFTESVFNPDSVQTYINLSLAYYKNGDIQESIDVLNNLSDRFPSMKSQADSYIKRINAGEQI